MLISFYVSRDLRTALRFPRSCWNFAYGLKPYLCPKLQKFTQCDDDDDASCGYAAVTRAPERDLKISQ